jgi:hypothetical protein
MDQVINDLLDEFLGRRTFQKNFVRKLFEIARKRAGVSWETRCLAILMAEHQILKLQPDNLEAFDYVFTQLNLKVDERISAETLKEGYSTTELRPFIREFQARLARLNRVHGKIRGRSTSESALREFVEASRNDCKLSARQIRWGLGSTSRLTPSGES